MGRLSGLVNSPLLIRNELSVLVRNNDLFNLNIVPERRNTVSETIIAAPKLGASARDASVSLSAGIINGPKQITIPAPRGLSCSLKNCF